MKKIIAIIAMAVAMTGCAGYDDLACRDSVVKAVGTQDVIQVERWKFVARDTEGNVWYMKTMHTSDTDVTSKTLLFKAVK